MEKLAPEFSSILELNLEQGLPVISLSSANAYLTAFSNDKDFVCAYANEVLAYGQKGDTLLAISTSGNSKDVFLAAVAAKSIGMNVVALTGDVDSKLLRVSDVTIKAPAQQTHRISELHLPIYNAMCLAIEEEIFNEEE